MTTIPSQTIVGSGSLRFAADPDWCRLPAGEELGEAVGVATDSHDRVFLFTRTPEPPAGFRSQTATFSTPGKTSSSSARTAFTSGPTTASTAPTTRIIRSAVLLPRANCCSPWASAATLPTPAPPAPIIARSAAPPARSTYPTNVALSPAGEIYVSDGYGNACIHRFSPDGRLLASWGQPGDGPGQFHVPHGIAIDRQRHGLRGRPRE